MGAERRIFPRTLIRKSSVAEKDLPHDISECGAFISTDRVAKVGSVIQIELRPPGWKVPLPVKAEVIRIAVKSPETPEGRVGMAVRFVELDPEKAKKIREAILAYGA